MSKKGLPRSVDSPELREIFLDTLRKTGNVGQSASVININRGTAYRWKKDNKEFSLKWDEAMDAAADIAEAEVRRRAIEGWDEPVFYQGNPVGVIRKYSDRMLELHIKALKPDKYRESVNVTPPILIQIQGVEQLKQLRATNPWNGRTIEMEKDGANSEEIPHFLPIKVNTETGEANGREGFMEAMRAARPSRKGLTAAEIAEDESDELQRSE